MLRFFLASELIYWAVRLLPKGTPGRAELAAGYILLIEHKIRECERGSLDRERDPG